ncbi:MAG TPA: IclR family transcriptional regulator C-terminal domain-containing protein [Microlunatus sp.]
MAEEFVQSLARGLQVITAFDSDRSRMSLSEVAVATGLSRASARRFLHTLVELGYVRTDGKQFELTPHVLRLGTAYLSGLGLPQLAQPHLERLSADVGESTSAAVLDGTEIVYVARVSTRRIMTVGITVGTRFPAFATSMGRVLLAYQGAEELDDYFLTADLRPPTPRTLHTESELRPLLAEVAAQGWAEVDQELEVGLFSLAAPVRDVDGAVVAAINVSTTGPERPAALRDRVLAAAAAISTDLASTSLR